MKVNSEEETDLGHSLGRPIRAVVTLGLAALCVLLLANAFVTYRATQQLIGASHWVEHTLAVDSQLQVVGSLVKDAETGQRGYLLTGDPGYLDPYSAAGQQLPSALQALGDMTADNPDQVQNVQQLKELTASKLAELRNTVELYEQGHADAARAMVQTNVGRNKMEEIRATLARMEAAERKLLTQRQQSLQNVELKERIALILGLTIGLLAIVTLGWALHRMALVEERATAEVRES